jgi:hypothetical protein
MLVCSETSRSCTGRKAYYAIRYRSCPGQRLARRPRLLGARVTKVLVLARRAGVWYSMPDMYEMALFEEDCPMRKGDLELEGRVTIRRPGCQ